MAWKRSALGLAEGDYSKCRQATSQHLLQRVFSVNLHCVCVAHTHTRLLAHTHTCVPCTHTRVLPRTHMSVFSHTHMCVSECSSEALFCASVQKRRNLRVDTSPTVLNRISLHHLSSSTCLKASRSLPRKKKITVFFLAGGRGSSAESHLPPNFELHCAGSGPHQSTSFELLCPSEAFPKRAVANSFLVSTCIFDSARQSVQNQRCLQSRGLSTAEGHIRLNSSPRLKPSRG